MWAQVEQLQKCVEQGDPDEGQEASERLTLLAKEVDVEFVLGDLAKAIRESQEGSERIRHIVHDLRDFSYQDTGERVLADINQCLDSTANIVWPMMKHLVILEKQYAGPSRAELLPDAAQAGVHEPARQRLPGDRGEARRRRRDRARSSCARSSAEIRSS